MKCRFAFLGALLLGLISSSLFPAVPKPADSLPGDALFAEYFRRETLRLAEACLADINTLEEWQARRPVLRQQLLEMLGLWPLPERTDLQPVITGKVEHEQFTVENVHFQSRPGLYVTGNLYVPKGLTEPAPAILYVCGHARVASDGVSYGGKTNYQHHGAWFARHGYVCLIIDTIQLGELSGIHHGTYREGMWWWNARGYTPAGVEAWNSMRALDYLQSRPEVDPQRLGVTGRSGGGSYSWWTAAIDERIKAAVPVAGITDLQNYVLTPGVMEGHCDCMFMLNTHQWDYPLVAAMIAPRALLLTNTDRDRIFPLDGVVRLYEKVRKIYELHGAREELGLVIGPGPHQDTQDLQVPAFRWFDRVLKKEQPLIGAAAEKYFTPQQLKVFSELPAEQITTTAHETFVELARPTVPADAGAWTRQRASWEEALRTRVFGGWPQPDPGEVLDARPVLRAEHEGVRLQAYDYLSQAPFHLRLYVVRSGTPAGDRPVTVRVLDAQSWNRWVAAAQVGFAGVLSEEGRVAAAYKVSRAEASAWAAWRADVEAEGGVVVYLVPRGIGLTAISPDANPQAPLPQRRETHQRRRFQMLGQTLDGMRVWDIRRGLQVARAVLPEARAGVRLQSTGSMAVNALYASLYEPVSAVELRRLPASHREGPDYLNILRFLDVPQALAWAAERTPVRLVGAASPATTYARETARRLGWPADRLSESPR